MSLDYTALGRTAFQDGMSEEEIKHQHPQFRAGWRAAKKQFDAQNQPISSLRPEKVERIDPDNKWTLQWADLTAISGYHPWNVLEQRPQLRVLAKAARTLIWERRDEIEHFGDAVKMYRVMWEGMLQQGYDGGVLDLNDLKQYDFTPKQLREEVNG